MIFTSGLPADTLATVAQELLHKGLRLVSSSAETGVAGGSGHRARRRRRRRRQR
jgi:hypothetical protein